MNQNSKLIYELYDKIEKENIILMETDTISRKAVTIKDENTKDYGIFYENNCSDTNEEFCVLAHEYGHCKSGSTHKLYSKFQLIGQHENRANRAAIYEFLPVEKIKDAFKREYFEYWEIAEYLDLPESFIIMAIEIYRVEEKL